MFYIHCLILLRVVYYYLKLILLKDHFIMWYRYDYTYLEMSSNKKKIWKRNWTLLVGIIWKMKIFIIITGLTVLCSKRTGKAEKVIEKCVCLEIFLKKNENTYGFIQGNCVNEKKRNRNTKRIFRFCRTKTGNGIAYNFMTIISISISKNISFQF